jgi:hypothetical protein
LHCISTRIPLPNFSRNSESIASGLESNREELHIQANAASEMGVEGSVSIMMMMWGERERSAERWAMTAAGDGGEPLWRWVEVEGFWRL